MDRILTVDELIQELEKYTHKELHVHHTWKPNHVDWKAKPDPYYWQESMRKYHIKNNGWADIGQHVTLLPDGRFITGRDFSATPASIQGYNVGAFAVEMFGNFDKGHDTFGGAQKQAMITLARWFYNKGRYIRFHRENSSKTCPGSSIDKEEFMKEVKNLKQHWAQKYYDFLTEEKGIVIYETRFNDTVTRGELFALMARMMGYKEG